jgi:hypothetical protein
VLKATALGSGRVRIAAKKTSEMASTSKHNGRSGGAWARTMRTASLVEILRSLHATLVAQFWRCWLALTAAVVTGSA